jgi:hypothetical protein
MTEPEKKVDRNGGGCAQLSSVKWNLRKWFTIGGHEGKGVDIFPSVEHMQGSWLDSYLEGR